jgi:hypothetical protein
MSLAAAYLHLVFAMFLVGYVLYWAIMVVSLGRDLAPPETERLLGIANRSRWPHVLVPWRLRLPLPLMGWGFLAMLVITGLVLMASYALGPLLVLKVALVLLFALVQAALTRRPGRALIMVNFALALAIVVVSGLLGRV